MVQKTGETTAPAGKGRFDSKCKMECQKAALKALRKELTIRAHKALSKRTRSAYVELAVLFPSWSEMALEQMSLPPSGYTDPREKVFPITKRQRQRDERCGQKCVYDEGLAHYS